jgi:hypothetical protein
MMLGDALDFGWIKRLGFGAIAHNELNALACGTGAAAGDDEGRRQNDEK